LRGSGAAGLSAMAPLRTAPECLILRPLLGFAPARLEAVVAEADVVADQRPLQAALLAVMGHHSYRSPSLRGGALPYLSCPRLTPREYQVLDRLACGLSDREIARELMVSEATARTYTKRLLQTLGVNNRLQAVLKGMRCGMVQI
jgi:DNA-binding NarL/FixJ family response regulator